MTLAVLPIKSLIVADVTTFNDAFAPPTSNRVLAKNVLPFPFVRVLAVPINDCVAINQCWKVLAVVN